MQCTCVSDIILVIVFLFLPKSVQAHAANNDHVQVNTGNVTSPLSGGDGSIDYRVPRY